MKKFKRKEVLCLENGKVSKPYDEIGNFVDGFAIVLSNGMYGFIDEELNEIVAPQFDEVHNFYNGYAIVKNISGWGAIDKTGKIAIDNQFFFLGDFNSCGLAPYRFLERYGAIDTNGNIAVKAIYELDIHFYEGMARVRRGSRWGFVDESFKEVIPPIYDLAKDFQCGKAFVLLSNGDIHYINHQGKFVE